MKSLKPIYLVIAFLSFAACTPRPSVGEEQSYADYVNPFIGTDFTGNTYPGAQGRLVQLSPDNGLPGWELRWAFTPSSLTTRNRQVQDITK